jgi:uncharacterized membrane protein
VVFFRVHPLADSDPAERPEARQETPAAEAVDWLQNPTDDASRKPSANMRYIEMLENAPQWTGPIPDEDNEDNL